MASTLVYAWHRRLPLAVAVIVVAVCSSVALVWADGSYGSGTYGSCQYNSCGISLTTIGTVNLNITPGTGTTCTVDKDTVSVLTDSSTGYTLTIADSDTSNQLVGGAHGQNVAATSSSAATPSTLTTNTWGYRVDGVGSFGAGPTSAQANGTIPSTTFAAVPLSSATADTIATATTAANPAVSTPVWFGVCSDTTTVSDTYTDGVVYTAVVN